MPPLHTVPHVPQFCAFERVSTHAPLQLISGDVHPLVEQCPAMHTEPLAHAMPHAPQFIGFDPVSTQLPLQLR